MPSIRSLLLGTSILLAAGGVAVTTTRAAYAATGSTSALPVFPGLQLLGSASAAQSVQFDVVLPLRNTAALDTLLAQQQTPGSPQYHQWLTPASFASQFGPSQITMLLAATALRLFGLQVTPQARSLHVTGTAAQVNAAFNVSLNLATLSTNGQQRLVVNKPLTLPTGLSGLGALVSAFSPRGFDAAPFIRQSSVGYIRQASAGYAANASSPAGGFLYNDLKQAYHYPSYQSTVTVNGQSQRLDGTGTTVAVVMAGDVLDSDVATLFDHEGFTASSGQTADPAIYARRPVNGGAAFSAANPASEEASVDVQQVLGGAPGTHLILYTTPDLSDQSLLSAYTAIVNDNTADVVSLSFGQCESYYTAAYNQGQDETAILATYSELFKQGNAQGITFVAASGDSSGLDCITPGYFSGGTGQFVSGVSTPAADPNVTAVGGTNLLVAPPANAGASSYLSENAWSDPEIAYDPYGLGSTVTGGAWGAGGGISSVYPRPSYQALVATGSSSFRTVPDVGMQMGGCPDIAQSPCNGGGSSVDGSGNTDRSYVNVVFNGLWDDVIGTSAAAPEMASAVALLVESKGRQGNLNPALYALAQSQASGGQVVLHQSVPGYNGVVANAGTYNYTTGNGTPDVSALLGLGSWPAAGSPQSVSNP